MKAFKLLIALSFVGMTSIASAGPTLTFASGEVGKGYVKIFKNISSVCGAEVPMQEDNTTGGVDNLGELASKKADVGMASLSTFQSLQSTDDAIGRLRAVMPLNSNALHVFVSDAGYLARTGQKECTGKEIFGKCAGGDWKDITETRYVKKMSDLKGLNVAAVGSAQVFARKAMINNPNIGMFNIVDVDKADDAAARLKKGDVQAVLEMTSYPYSRVDKLKQSDGVSLIKWDLPVPGGYKVAKKNYKSIGAYGTPLLIEQNILFARPVDPAGEIGQQVSKLKACITRNLSTLQEGKDYEPSWSDAGGALSDELPAWVGKVAPGKK